MFTVRLGWDFRLYVFRHIKQNEIQPHCLICLNPCHFYDIWVNGKFSLIMLKT